MSVIKRPETGKKSSDKSLTAMAEESKRMSNLNDFCNQWVPVKLFYED